MADMNDIQQTLQTLSAQVAALSDAQRRRDELFDELTPILREVLGVTSGRLETLEQRGYFAFGKALLEVLDRVVTGYSPQDVHEFAEAIVAILDAARAMTQPQMLRMMTDLSDSAQHAAEMEPVGIFGMLRATKDVDSGRGIAVMIEVMRRLGHGARQLDRKESLRAQLGPRRPRPKAEGRPPRTGAERPLRPERVAAKPAPPPAPKPAAAPAASPAPGAREPVVIDGVAFTAEGFMVDHAAWNRELAQALAASIGVTLGEQHWTLIDFARQEYEKTGASPNIRRLTQGSGISTKELYTMFPKAPGKCTAMIAGLPKPVGCI